MHSTPAPSPPPGDATPEREQTVRERRSQPQRRQVALHPLGTAHTLAFDGELAEVDGAAAPVANPILELADHKEKETA